MDFIYVYGGKQLIKQFILIAANEFETIRNGNTTVIQMAWFWAAKVCANLQDFIRFWRFVMRLRWQDFGRGVEEAVDRSWMPWTQPSTGKHWNWPNMRDMTHVLSLANWGWVCLCVCVCVSMNIKIKTTRKRNAHLCGSIKPFPGYCNGHGNGMEWHRIASSKTIKQPNHSNSFNLSLYPHPDPRSHPLPHPALC